MLGKEPAGEDKPLQAYLFQLGDSDQFAVSLDPTGSNLPTGDRAEWCLRKEFSLGVQDPMPVPMDPEPVLRGIRVRGYFTWHLYHTEPFGTSQ